MKVFVTFAVLLLACFAAAKQESYCYDRVANDNFAAATETEKCDSIYGGIKYSFGNLNKFFSNKLATSYDYLLLQTHFDSYQKNRPGFKKLFAGLSDQAWDESVDLIKFITKRGGMVDFSGFKNESLVLSTVSAKSLELEELQALGTALDSEKTLGTEAFLVHQHASHLNHEQYDPELSQYVEEKFLEKQAGTIRKLSGYVNDLQKLSKAKDPSLNIYLFDEYLAKQ